jgi:transcriptional regulator with XRE-family HTH domain
LRKSRGFTQFQLQARSSVSRSYLARIESGSITPSLGTVEKISEALGIALYRFFVSDIEGLLEDRFVRELRPYLKQLDFSQRESILLRLAQISPHSERRGECESSGRNEEFRADL